MKATWARLTYQPGRSPLHRLHPLTKAVWLISITALAFLLTNPRLVVALTALLGTGLLALRAALGLSPGRGERLVLLTALTLGLLQVLFQRQGIIVWRAGPLIVTRQGLRMGAYVSGRFLSVVLVSALFVSSTDPNDLAYALMQAGLPYRYGFAMVTALRLVPVFEREAQMIYRAQLVRGVRYDVQDPRRLLWLARQLFLPLLVSALRRAETLALSMEGRCFGRYRTRTFARSVPFRPSDGALLALGLLLPLAAGVGRWRGLPWL